MKKQLNNSISILLACVLTACGGGGDKQADPDMSTGYTSAQAYVENTKFNGAILVRKSGNDILRKAFGYADKTNHIENTIETHFRIGSLTKAFTSLAIVQLKNLGLITSYDDRLSDYVSGFSENDNITLRHLLNHQSGLQDYVEFTDNNKAYTPEQLIELIKNKPLNFTPGTQFQYANINYALLGYIIEQLSGLTYHDYLESNIFQPLGMTNTKKGANVITGVEYAQGYQDNFEQASYQNMSIPYAAGSLSSNLADMELWVNSFEDLTLISQADAEQIFNQGSYGFGWSVGKDGELKVISHSGGISGFASIIVIAPEVDGLVIALGNNEDFFSKLGPMVSSIISHEFK